MMNILDHIKGVLYHLGIINGLKKTEKREIPVSAGFYKEVEKWSQLYKGYCPEAHDLRYTVQGKNRERKMLSMMMAKHVAAEMASLICNEKMNISYEDGSVEGYINSVLEDNNYTTNLQYNIENMFALGGVAIEAFFDGEKVKLNYINANSFFPLAYDSSKRIKECVIKVEETQKDKYVYTLLRRHEYVNGIYTITNELYERSIYDVNSMGQKCSLARLYPELQEVVQYPLATRPFFAYCKPNSANNLDLDSPLGISIFANAVDTLKSIDTVFDSMQREFVLGKKRILVPETFIKSRDGRVAMFDPNDECFLGMAGMEVETIQDISVEIRTTEHIEAINKYLNILASQCGFSAGTFTYDSQGLKTATEVVSENSKTFKSKKSHEQLIEKFIKDTVNIILELSDAHGIFAKSDDVDITVSFDDSIVEDSATTINQQVLLVSSNLQSKLRAVMKIHGVGEKEAEDILKEIQGENQIVSPEVSDIFGAE